MKITIFGSCRQDALYRYYDVTSIRETLTYPHYSAEILQAIKYCCGSLDPNQIFTKFAFRTEILTGKKPNSKKIRAEFNNSDLFVLEIATRKTYKHKGIFLHHICDEEKYSCKFLSEVNIYDSTDNDIEKDLVEIKKLLAQKKFFVVTHFYTKKTGKRYELVELLKNLCAKHSIPIFDPVEALGGVGKVKELLLEEDVYNHYNRNGHEEVGQCYVDFIMNNFSIAPRLHSKLRYKTKLFVTKFFSILKSVKFLFFGK